MGGGYKNPHGNKTDNKRTRNLVRDMLVDMKSAATTVHWKAALKMPLIFVLCMCTLHSLSNAQASSSSSDDFVYRRGPIPDVFSQGTRYPDRNETDECRPIRLRVVRSSRLYTSQLVTNVNPMIIFHSADARIMTRRMQARLNALAASYHRHYHAMITVRRAWSEYSANDTIGDPTSLHYEGKLTYSIQQQ